jgi:hypothetical protein
MTPELDQLVSEAADVTGVAKPAWLEDDAPLLAETADGKDAARFYLIGLIGGKDVGKSALVNALVGLEITARTSHGPGTETVIAYAHADQAAALRELLEREVPGRYSIVEHRIAGLARQVLLDLPDIDSHWVDHVAVTRKMLRHMLFPIWVQSIEKYADRQPQELLAKVAAGNAPGNFIFCLNKVDQLEGSGFGVQGSEQHQAPAIQQLQEDYAVRLQRVLNLNNAPRIWAISALRSDRYDLPALRGLLAQQKSEEAVRESKAKAALRQKSSVLEWLATLDLPARAARLARLHEEAEEFVNDRLGVPLLETMMPRLTDDPLYRQTVIDDCMAKRVARWPIVNVLHVLFATIGAFLRRNAEPIARPLLSRSGDALIDHHLTSLSAPPSGRSLADIIQTTFALLQQSHPSISALYAERKLWEPMPASDAAAELRNGLIGTADRQRAVACENVEKGSGPLAGAARFLLTIGALIWFPFIQPMVKAILSNAHGSTQPAGSTSLLTGFVDMLSMTYLLNLLTFFVIYFSILWLVLRGDTQRRVARQFARWRRLENLDPALSLPGQTLEWLANLVEPVRTARERVEKIARKVEELRTGTGTSDR